MEIKKLNLIIKGFYMFIIKRLFKSFNFMLFLLIFFGNTSLLLAESSEFVPNVVRVGDHAVTYKNVEFTSDGKYMVWLETRIENGQTREINWHCGINPETGDLIPSDGKGFMAFVSSSSYSRANPGMDIKGAYYIGIDTEGRLVFVRPTGPTTGEATVLSTPPDITRRAVYPTDLPEQDDGYVFWIKNEKVLAVGNLPVNDWFELQYIKISEPDKIYIIERQYKPAQGFVAFDIAFARVFRKKPFLTYGFYDKRGYLQIKQFDFTKPDSPPVQVTYDPYSKVDPYPLVFNDKDVLIAGINGEDFNNVYTRFSGNRWFSLTESFSVPESTSLENPSLAQSNEPVIFNNNLYTAYQVNNKGARFQDTTFAQTGEIWLASLLQDEPKQWRVSENNDLAKFEPEPYPGKSKVWVFYNAMPAGSDIFTETWGLYRAETPININN